MTTMLFAGLIIAAMGLGWALGQGMQRVACPLCSELLKARRLGDIVHVICTECDFEGTGTDFGGNFGDPVDGDSVLENE